MARKSQHTFSKRQREQKKAEKAAQKRAKRAESKEAPPLGDGENGVEHAPVAEDDVVASDSETAETGSKPESE